MDIYLVNMCIRQSHKTARWVQASSAGKLQ